MDNTRRLSAANDARDAAVDVLECALRGEVVGARRTLAESPDPGHTAEALVRLLGLLLPSFTTPDLKRAVAQCRKIDLSDEA